MGNRHILTPPLLFRSIHLTPPLPYPPWHRPYPTHLDTTLTLHPYTPWCHQHRTHCADRCLPDSRQCWSRSCPPWIQCLCSCSHSCTHKIQSRVSCSSMHWWGVSITKHCVNCVQCRQSTEGHKMKQINIPKRKDSRGCTQTMKEKQNKNWNKPQKPKDRKKQVTSLYT